MKKKPEKKTTKKKEAQYDAFIHTIPIQILSLEGLPGDIYTSLL